MKGREEAARRSYKKVRGFTSKSSADVVAISKEIESLMEKNSLRISEMNDTILDKLKRPEVYKPVLILIGFFAFQQLSGIFVIIVFAVRFLTEAGVQLDPFLGAILIGCVRLGGHTAVLYILDRFGRKPPAIYGGLGMGICMIGLALITGLKIQSTWLPMFLILLFIFTSTIGFLTLPFAMIAEVFPQNVRGFASGLCVCSCYALSFFMVKLYPSMVKAFGNEYVFLFYGIASFVGIGFVTFFLPETKGKTLEEIENSFKPKEPSLGLINMTQV